MIISSLPNSWKWNAELDANKCYHWLVIECKLQLVHIPYLNLYTQPPWLEQKFHKFGLTKGVTTSLRFWSTTIHSDLHQGNSKPNRLKLGNSSFMYSKNCQNTRRMVLLNSNRYYMADEWHSAKTRQISALANYKEKWSSEFSLKK